MEMVIKRMRRKVHFCYKEEEISEVSENYGLKSLNFPPQIKEIPAFENKLFNLLNIRQDQVNLLVYGPNRPYFKQKQENNITKFWPSGFFTVYYTLLFEKNKK